MRIAQAVFAQVLAGAGDDDDARAALVEPGRGVLGQRHGTRDGVGRRRALLAAAAGLGGRRGRCERGDKDEAMQEGAAHRVILSL